MTLYDAPFALGEKVVVDDDASVVGVVTAFCWRVEAPQVEVSWWHAGDAKSAWFTPWRLRRAGDRPSP